MLDLESFASLKPCWIFTGLWYQYIRIYPVTLISLQDISAN